MAPNRRQRNQNHAIKTDILQNQLRQNITRRAQRLVLVNIYQLFQNAFALAEAILLFKGQSTMATSSANKPIATSQAATQPKTDVFSTTGAKNIACSTAINTPKRTKGVRQTTNYCIFHNTSLYNLILI
jgi:hypothetical protein